MPSDGLMHRESSQGQRAVCHSTSCVATLLLALVALTAHSVTAATIMDDHPNGHSEALGWILAVIVVGCVAVTAAVIVPIACCCQCHACEGYENQLPTQYPSGDRVSYRSHDAESQILSNGERKCPMTPCVSSGSMVGGGSLFASSWQPKEDTYARDDDAQPPYQQGRRASGNGYGNAVPSGPSLADEGSLLFRGQGLTGSQVWKLRRLSNRETADPAFGEFVDNDVA